MTPGAAAVNAALVGLRRVKWAALWSLMLLAGCSIAIKEPVTAAVVPTPVKVVVTGNASYSNFRLVANGIDVTSQMAYQGNNTYQGLLSLPPGSAILDASADVYCWYCGGSTHSTSHVTFTVLSSHMFIDIDAGEAHTCAVDSTNKAWCWGDNTNGQLGTGTAPDTPCSLDPAQPQHPCRLNPAAVDGNTTFRTVSAGQSHTCGLSTGGQVFCWGRNDRGQLGNGTQADSRVPVPVSHPTSFKAVSAGDAHTCAIDVAGELYCWGDNGRGQLGVIGVNNCLTGTQTGCSPVPVRQGTGINGGSFLFAEVSAGGRHTCASNLQTIKCWGENTDGQLGIGTMGAGTGGANANLSVNGQYLTYATAAGTNLGPGLSAGFAHTCAFRSAGSGASCWGDNHSDQLGGSWPQASFPDPKPAAAGSGHLMTGIGAGFVHTCALMQSPVGSRNQPVCAGRNDRGQLGTASHTASSTFAPVSFSTSAVQDFFKITAGKGHSCALSVVGRSSTTPGGTDFFGAAYCWGDNTYGQVGQNYDAQWLTPAEVHF